MYVIQSTDKTQEKIINTCLKTKHRNSIVGGTTGTNNSMRQWATWQTTVAQLKSILAEICICPIS